MFIITASITPMGVRPLLNMPKSFFLFHRFFRFGSRVKMIKEIKARRVLSALMAGGPRSPIGAVIHPTELNILDSESDFYAIFLGWNNNPAASLLLKLSGDSNRIMTGHHIIVDSFGISYNHQRINCVRMKLSATIISLIRLRLKIVMTSLVG